EEVVILSGADAHLVPSGECTFGKRPPTLDAIPYALKGRRGEEVQVHAQPVSGRLGEQLVRLCGPRENTQEDTQRQEKRMDGSAPDAVPGRRSHGWPNGDLMAWITTPRAMGDAGPTRAPVASRIFESVIGIPYALKTKASSVAGSRLI